jgi:hypothetical protein
MSYLGRTGKLSQRAYNKLSFLATAGQTVKSGLSYVAGFVEVYVNGTLLTDVVDYSASNGNSVTFLVALSVNDEVTVVSLKTFVAANMLPLSGGTLNGDLDVAGSVTVDGNVGIGTSSPLATLSIKGTTNELDIETTAAGVTLESIDRADSTKQSDMSFYARYGNHTFYSGAYTEVMRIDNTGIVSIPNGISFGDAGGSAGTTNTSNTLDEYEEGTWTPTTTYGSLTASSATYTRIGRQVTVAVVGLGLTDLTTNAAVEITGLPFTSLSSATGAAMWAQVTVSCDTAYITSGVYFYAGHTSGNFVSLKHINLNSGNNVYFTVTYFTPD